LDIVLKIRPLSENSSPPLVPPAGLRACSIMTDPVLVWRQQNSCVSVDREVF